MSLTHQRETRAQASRPWWTPSPARIYKLPTETLRLMLDERNLGSTGRRDQLIARLLQATAAPTRGDGDRHSESSSDPETEGGGDKNRESTGDPSHTDSSNGSGEDDPSNTDGNGDTSEGEESQPDGDRRSGVVGKRPKAGPRDGDRQRGTSRKKAKTVLTDRDHQHHTSVRKAKLSRTDGDRQRGTSRGKYKNGQTEGDRQRGTSGEEYNSRQRASSGRNGRTPERHRTVGRSASRHSRLHLKPTGRSHHHSSSHRSRPVNRHSSSRHVSRRAPSPSSSSSERSRSPRWDRQHRDSSSPSSGNGSRTETSISSSDASASSSSRSYRHRHRCHHSHHRCHRRHHHSHYRRQSPASCLPTVSSRLRRKITRGEFVEFDKLLAPSSTPPLAVTNPARKRKRHASPRRKVVDGASWLEAWNQFLRIRVTHDPSQALSLIKYQSHMVMLFTHYPQQACIEYDRLFRQAAARDPLVRWDRFKEDVFVWTLTPRATTLASTTPQPPGSTRPPFQAVLLPAHDTTTASQRDRPPITARLGPPTAAASSRSKPSRPKEPHSSHSAAGEEICKRFNWGRCSRSDCTYAHTCWTPGCNGSHPAVGCPKRPQ